MLSYRHAFHAGNFADVMKHVVLMCLISHLVRKEAPLLYLDTHAGAGLYDLDSPPAQQTGEYRDGIGLLWQLADFAEPLREYVDLVKGFNDGGRLHRYPGSPCIAHRMLRAVDRLEFFELHPRDFALLENRFRGARRVFCHAGDGFELAPGRLPPLERRGLVFIDPSYEIKTDYTGVVDALLEMHRRFTTGVYALWYPLVDSRLTGALKSAFRQSGLRDVLNLELALEQDAARPGLRGCGMFVVNPPWTLAADMEPVLQDLALRFSRGRPTRARVETFLPE